MEYSQSFRVPLEESLLFACQTSENAYRSIWSNLTIFPTKHHRPTGKSWQSLITHEHQQCLRREDNCGATSANRRCQADWKACVARAPDDFSLYLPHARFLHLTVRYLHSTRYKCQRIRLSNSFFHGETNPKGTNFCPDTWKRTLNCWQNNIKLSPPNAVCLSEIASRKQNTCQGKNRLRKPLHRKRWRESCKSLGRIQTQFSRQTCGQCSGHLNWSSHCRRRNETSMIHFDFCTSLLHGLSDCLY
jgi:hypothetical protein